MKLILESNLTPHQKTHTLTISGILLILIIQLFGTNLNTLGYLFLFISISLFISSIIFSLSKKGLVVIDLRFYKAHFFLGQLLYKKEIKLKNKEAITVLKYKSRQKMAFFSAAKPDLATTFNSFELTFLNKRHTRKFPIFRLKKEDNAKKGIDFITSNLNVKHEIYSPDFW